MSPTCGKFLNGQMECASCTRTLVFEWHLRFCVGNEEINDDKRHGRPSEKSKEY